MPSYKADISLKMDARKQSVYEYASRISQQANYTPNDGELRRIVEETLEGTLEYDDPTHWDIDQSGSLVVYSDDTFTITLPNATAVTRDNFTIAHEIGHYLLHALAGNIFNADNREKVISLEPYPLENLLLEENQNAIVFARYDSGQLEWEANWFAAAFLMPTSAVSDAITRYGTDITSIAAQFRVSPEVVKHRLQYYQDMNV